jgi:hypothetical protein
MVAKHLALMLLHMFRDSECVASIEAVIFSDLRVNLTKQASFSVCFEATLCFVKKHNIENALN